MFDPKHILVPVALDPDEKLLEASRAVEAACDLAQKFDASVTILCLAPLLHSGDGSAIDVTGQVYQVLAETLKARADQGRKKLKELENLVKDRGIKTNGRMLDSFDGTAEVIIDFAEDIKADLLIISSEGPHGLAQRIFGTLWEEIALKAKIPVLVIHPNNLGISNDEGNI
jgi:nucleotide-binding universal stress UspA family protein